MERSIGEVKIELAQQIKAQKESEVRGREAVERSIGEVRSELAAQREAVERSIGEVKIELAQQIKAQKESEVRGGYPYRGDASLQHRALRASVGCMPPESGRD